MAVSVRNISKMEDRDDVNRSGRECGGLAERIASMLGLEPLQKRHDALTELVRTIVGEVRPTAVAAAQICEVLDEVFLSVASATPAAGAAAVSSTAARTDTPEILTRSSTLLLAKHVLSIIPEVMPLLAGELGSSSEETDEMINNSRIRVYEHALQKASRPLGRGGHNSVLFEEASAVIKESLAECFSHPCCQLYRRAADTLRQIDLESGVRQLDDEYKFRICVKTAMLCLEGNKCKCLLTCKMITKRETQNLH